MIGNITTGSCFRGLVDYLLDPCKIPQIIDTNLSGCDRQTMTWELNTCAAQRPNTKKPVKHISIGFTPDDGKVNPETIEEIALAIVEELGYGDNQYLVVQHDRIDPEHERVHEHDHFHILINMINLEGKRVKDNYDKKRLEKILRQQEIKHNLTIVSSSEQRQYKATTNGQVQRMMRELETCQSGIENIKSTAPYTLKIQSGIDLASHDRPSLSVFLARLQRLEINPRLRIESGEVKGISYRLQDFKVRGCKLHRSSFKQLLKHRVTYDPHRDISAVNQVNQAQKIKLDTALEVSWSQTNLRKYVPLKINKMLDSLSDKTNFQLEEGIKIKSLDCQKSNALEIDF